jgi:uncharacterized protein YcbK (DUF882 family)
MTLRLSRRQFLKISAASVALNAVTWSVPASARPILEQPTRKLILRNPYTEETASATFWKRGQYDAQTLHAMNRLLRDRRSGDMTRMDPRLFEILQKLQGQLQYFGPIDVISGYRTPASNRIIAEYIRGVAKKSYHILGKAVDIRIPGIKTSHIHRALVSLDPGGVGYYGKKNFIHLDTGPARTWSA